MTVLGIFLNKEMRTGANRRYLELLEALAEKGCRVFVIMNSLLPYEPRFFTKISLTVPYVRKGFPPASFLFCRAVRRYWKSIHDALKETQVDWIHIHSGIHLNAALTLCRKTGASLFFAFRSNEITRESIVRKTGGLSPGAYCFSLLYERISRRREKTIAKRAKITAFQNTPDRDLYCGRTGADKQTTVIIPGNIGLPRCTDDWKNKNQQTAPGRIVFACGLSLSKGLLAMFSIFSDVVKKAKHPPHLYVLGRGDEQETAAALKAMERFGLKPFVSFEGYVNPPFPFFVSCGLLVYPTLYDAFPDTVLEALHCGCPVLASRTGGLPDILPDECLFDNRNPEKAVQWIVRGLEEPDFYKRMKDLCVQQAERFRFDWAQAWLDAMEHAQT